MNIWALADLHLAFSNPSKSMEVFGGNWINYTEKIEANWRSLVAEDDLVLIPGDISWALKLESALIDLEWLDKLPGTKVVSKGNHDYWWPSNAKLTQKLPKSITFVNASARTFRKYTIAGTRLWDIPGTSFEDIIQFTKAPPPFPKENLPLYEKELKRLEKALQALDPSAERRIAMVHYPPIAHDLRASTRASDLLEKYNVDTCLFGHLHSVIQGAKLFGTKNGVTYRLTSCDYLDCTPLRIV